ncbi:putative seven-in-absentia protein, TRAF [Helianthus anomalus]
MLHCFECETHVQNQCPTCRQELGNIRSFALEKFVQLLQLPCRYSSSGCLEIIPYSAKLPHEALCNFRHYKCPYAGVECPVTGDIPLLVTHLRA